MISRVQGCRGNDWSNTSSSPCLLPNQQNQGEADPIQKGSNLCASPTETALHCRRLLFPIQGISLLIQQIIRKKHRRAIEGNFRSSPNGHETSLCRSCFLDIKLTEISNKITNLCSFRRIHSFLDSSSIFKMDPAINHISLYNKLYTHVYEQYVDYCSRSDVIGCVIKFETISDNLLDIMKTSCQSNEYWCGCNIQDNHIWKTVQLMSFVYHHQIESHVVYNTTHHSIGT